MTTNPFEPAVKAQIKARVAFTGPTGSGKTWTALGWASVLAGPDPGRRENGLARVAFIDTERRSASLYAPHFTFDVVNMAPPYKVPVLLEHLRAAEANGYAVAVIDSLSHFWEGEGGVLDVVDATAALNRGNKFDAWRVGTPLQRNMVDTILGLDMHVIACMRAKMVYAQSKAIVRGEERTVIEKLGEAPVQRSGMEYEFQIVGDLDLQHRLTISKSRCDVLADRVIQPHREREAAKEFAEWLDTGEPLAERDEIAALVGPLDAIEDREARTAAKQAFVAEFGKPSELTAAALPEALAWVAAYLAPPTAPDGPTAPRSGPQEQLETAGAPEGPANGPEAVQPLPDDVTLETVDDAVRSRSVAQVRAELALLGLSVDGTAAELRERLAQSYVNRLVGLGA